MRYNGKHLDISNSYNDFMIFVNMLNNGLKETYFDSKWHWNTYLRYLRDLQIKLAHDERAFLPEKDIERWEQVKNLIVVEHLDNIFDAMCISGTFRYLILKELSKKSTEFMSYIEFSFNHLRPEAKRRLRQLRKELRDIDADETLSIGEKSIKSNYIKAEITNIKEGASYIPNVFKISSINSFNIGFSIQLKNILRNENFACEANWMRLKQQHEQLYHSLRNKENTWENPENVLYVHGGTIRCLRDSHKVRSIRANIGSVLGDFQINAMYCEDCGISFISNLEWDYYTHLYGNLIAHFRWISDNGVPIETVDFKVPHNKSVLYLCGYNVDAVVGLDAGTRQMILKKIIDNKVSRKTSSN